MGKASTIGIEISSTRPVLLSQRVKQCEIWRRFQRYLTLSRTRLKMR